MKTDAKKPVRVLFSCTGIGFINRGIESFFRESFDGLKNSMPGVQARLLKGAGNEDELEINIRFLPRTELPARMLGRLIRRNAYIAEQLSSFPAVVREIRRWKPDIFYYSEANLGFQLYKYRKWIGVPFRLLYSNGGPIHAPFSRMDFVHQVAPFYLEEALAAGEPPGKHFMVSYGIKVPPFKAVDSQEKEALRIRLGLPLERPVVISVGWIARQHKRMHYVIEELARLPKPRPYLQLLGAMDEQSPEIIELGRQLLGLENFSVKSVPYEEVADYYRAADCFVLASLKEGFGRVYLEALMHGLPVIAHRHPVMEYVLGEHGVFGDLSKVGVLTDLLQQQLKLAKTESICRQRWQCVRDRFDWQVLAPHYQKMFTEVARERDY